ncbi:hypothetical protein DY000_02017110 [Brassica cretica]|uniref:Defective in cullin neddylation protein n=1 Tax=Brassica cretica TaxID=69181 RepID=A0ABQ7CUJ2_BRACR|nr:hypothetical protein DY000_02017110 [Brassica cretica]
MILIFHSFKGFSDLDLICRFFRSRRLLGRLTCLEQSIVMSRLTPQTLCSCPGYNLLEPLQQDQHVFHHMILIFHSFKDLDLDMQVFQIWKTSGTTYISERFGFSDLEDFWDDLSVSRLKYNALDDFQEVFQTTFRKSSGLPGSLLDFLEVFWTSWKSSGLPGSLLTKSSSISSGL